MKSYRFDENDMMTENAHRFTISAKWSGKIKQTDL